METRPSLDRELILPLLIGGLSVIGIVVVLLIGRRLNSPAQVATTPSATPFQYIYLGTEPAISTPLIEGSEVVPGLEATEGIIPPFEETSIFVSPNPPPVLATPTRGSSVSTPLVLGTATASNFPSGGTLPTNTSVPTSTSASGPPLNAGTYDAIDSHLLYNGDWTPSQVAGNTLQVSNLPGSTISFRFIGRELRLFYQGGGTLGELRVTIDNVTATFDQSEGSEWVSSTFPNGTHTVLITHTGGGSVNLDYVIIPEVANTATPSVTPTATSTQ
jgi:hypothetical protein